MLIHLIPRMFACPVTEPLCELHDFESPELGLALKAGTDLVGRRPFPNKKYLVANRRIGRKAMNGILIETKAPIRAFTTITRWTVESLEAVVIHRITYRVLDDQFDMVTEDMPYWYAHSKDLGGFASRWPEGLEGSPVDHFPRMELVCHRVRQSVVDVCDTDGIVMERVEEFAMPTIERARIFDPCWRHDDRMPDPATAFQAAV